MRLHSNLNQVNVKREKSGHTLTREIANWLASARLDTNVDFYAEEIGDDWNADVKPLLCKIYDEAEAAGEKDIIYANTLPYEDYRSRIFAIRDYSRRIRSRFEARP